MNFSSQICTTEEQSKRLLALGLKAQTADMHHYQYTERGRWSIEARPSIAGYTNRLIPAWSLHRLIEILNIWHLDLNFLEFDNIYDYLITYFEMRVKDGLINKEYLK